MKKPNIRPIGNKEIKKILNGKEFIKRLKEASDITWNTDHETGFYVVRDIYKNRIIYGNVVGFNTEDYYNKPTESITGKFSRSIEPLLDKYSLNSYDNDIYPVIDIHFHPPPYSFKPSEEDIKAFLSAREKLYKEEDYGARINFNPIYIVGSQPTYKRNIELLLLQETNEKPLKRNYANLLFSLVENDLEDDEFQVDNEKIAEMYNQRKGIQACMLTYERLKNSYKLKAVDSLKISNFASNPKFLGYMK